MKKFSKLELRVLLEPETRIALIKMFKAGKTDCRFSIWFEHTFLADVSL